MSDASFARLFAMLQIIPAHPGTLDTTQVATLLAAEGFDTTARTVQRDLTRLESMGFGLECLDGSKPYRWRFVANAKPKMVPGLDIPQSLALLLVEAHLKRLVPRAVLSVLKPHLEAARAVVDGKPARRWLERVRVVPRSQPLAPPQVDVVILDAVQVALVEERPLIVRYRRADADDASEMTLHPLGFIMRDAVAYVVALAFDYNDIRLYALHRMKSATVGDGKARKAPAGFDLDTWLEGGETGWRLAKEPIAVELHFTHNAGRSVAESPLSKDQTVTRVGDVDIVKATVVDTRVLRAWILSFGASVEVKKPKALRTEIGSALQQAVARYHD